MSKYKIADVRFNNGNGTVLCNVCRIMLTDSCKASEQIDCAHLCEGCYNDLNAENFSKLYDFVSYVANDYFELSHEKVRVQRDDYVRKARKLLGELDGAL